MFDESNGSDREIIYIFIIQNGNGKPKTGAEHDGLVERYTAQLLLL